MTIFKPRQRVTARYAAGDRKERATLVKLQNVPGLPGWWLVRFDDRTEGSVHEDMLQPVDPEAQRLWILEEAERLNIPAFATDRWRRVHGARP